MEFKSEVKVQVVVIISKSFVIDGEESSIIIAIDVFLATSIICAESVVQSKVKCKWNIPSRNSIVPIWELGSVIKKSRVWTGRIVYWLSI
jgi:hypothetical protein